MKPILRGVLATLSLIVLSIYVSVAADQYILSLQGTYKFCAKQETVNPNLNSKEGDNIRLAYNCYGANVLSFIVIDYQSTPFDGCYVNLHNIKNLCYTTQLPNQGEGLTIKAGNCLDFPGQQLWNFVKTEVDGFKTFKIHPKGRSDLCLTSVLTNYRFNQTGPLSLQPCSRGHSTWDDQCIGRRFENFTCSQYDPSANCGIK